jgi:hypothetical protein
MSNLSAAVASGSHDVSAIRDREKRQRELLDRQAVAATASMALDPDESWRICGGG